MFDNIYILIPVYNEEQQIKKVILELKKTQAYWVRNKEDCLGIWLENCATISNKIVAINLFLFLNRDSNWALSVSVKKIDFSTTPAI